jgi:YgiT-type zinc finger domain-containing protein
MICTNCFEEEYRPAKTELTITLNDEKHVLRDLDCETCPACGDIIFTHAQSLEIDKRRITLISA